MVNYHINWEIDIYAESHEDAARKALTIMRDNKSIASVFNVTDEDGTAEKIDLFEIDEEEEAS